MTQSIIYPYPPLIEHQAALRACRQCPRMIPPVISCNPVLTPILMIGQAPGIREGDFQRPFAWTAGKTLFKWFKECGITEEPFRERVYMAAVCRCFPGKNPKGGDRVPNQEEIMNCSHWLQAELEILKPELIILVGKLAIMQYLPIKRLEEAVGVIHRQVIQGREVDLLPLPHPSGLSTWVHSDMGKTLLQAALQALREHPTWQMMLRTL
ncbi:uracil-DNA glycosylase family protein [Thiofilum flexile]|uniref:uracil-DNA glycosylase family protein n=1 Tax=Thiofilum flexile TaxID=125627 RepID=UPI000372500F|nr:uracil-DNA glycosylase family protein [Thiofilum flexile]